MRGKGERSRGAGEGKQGKQGKWERDKKQNGKGRGRVAEGQGVRGTEEQGRLEG